jgi:uncharacterized protein
MVKLLVVAALLIGGLALIVRMLESSAAFFPSRGEWATPADVGIPFEPVTLLTADGESLRGWLMRADEPRALVLYFHGNGGNLSVWLPILAGVVRRGYSVAAVDYRGYGLSTGTPGERGLYRDVDAAVRWAWESAQPGQPVVYWGRSLGATMAAYAASRREPRALILEAGFPDARTLLPRRSLLGLLAAFSSLRFPTADYLRDVTCPVLVMHGDADSVVPFSAGQRLFEAIQGPKQWFTIEGGDHNDAVPRDGDAYWATVERFIATAPAPR